MSYEDVKIKKGMITKIQDFFNKFISLFVKKQKGLPEVSEEVSEEYKRFKETYNELKKENTFSNLKKTYENYNIGENTDGKTVAVEKTTGYVIEDSNFISRVKFISIWRKSAIGNEDTKNEELAKEQCFDNDSEGIYNEIKECIQNQLLKTGNINTLEVLNKMKNSSYKWARSTSRRLFRNEIQAEIITDYFRSLTPKAKRKNKKTLTTSQALYGIEDEGIL